MKKYTILYLAIKMEIMSLALETGYKCKNCDGYIFGNYVWLEQKMYFRGQCKCSYWLVKTTQLWQTFN